MANPGSKEAQDAGCTCPILDNEYGEGVDYEDKKVFWITEGCPLHDTKEWLHG